MTYHKSRVSHTISRTTLLLKKNLWVWPVIAVIVLSIIGLVVNSAIESTMKSNLSSQLETLLNANTVMLEKWFATQTKSAESIANNYELKTAAQKLLEPAEEEAISLDQANFIKMVEPMMESHGFIGFFISDKTERIVSSSHAVLIGQQEVAQYSHFLNPALKGETTVSTPFSSVVMLKNKAGHVRTGEPTMYVCAPLRDKHFQVVGAIAFQLSPDKEFTETLQLGRVGESGETYAFNQNGLMVSNSRFDKDLILLGIIADEEFSRSILSVQVRDPEGDMTQGYRPTKRRSDMPLTVMAANAVEGNAGVNVDGYRDYRGVPVAGAWKWMPEYGIGVTTEIDIAEAFHALTILKRTFWILYSLLIVSAIAIFIFTVVVARLQQEARKAAIEAQQLGQYTLEEKLGAGAMGVVYRGHHAMLRRPTAIKLLNADRINDDSIKRFEREVQITCNLNHPSTIQVYDYGRTPEDVFYYAMEFLDGVDLQDLVEKDGPQPGGRVIHVMLQACGSLFEAHSQGLVHRDIKPANIMLNCRGGESDVVKVLDFGLVKAVDDQKQASLTGETGLTGTPLYMSPEAIQTPMSVDARSDLYGLGAVAYFLLTGQPVFHAESIVDLCQKHVDETPVAPSKRLGKSISEELENAILSCLEKTRAKRPQTARELANLFMKCPEYTQWSMDDADSWWRSYERNKTQTTDSKPASSTAGYDKTMDSES